MIRLSAAAQQKDTSRPSTDTGGLKKDLVSKVQEEAKKEERRSIEKYRLALSTRKQEAEIEEERNTLLRASDYLRNGLDTNDLYAEPKYLDTWYSIAVDGVLVHQGTTQTHRNLTTTYNILAELANRAILRKDQVDKFAKDVRRFRFIIDSLNADSMLYNFPRDSAELIRYFSKYIYVAREMSHVDSSIDKAIITAEVLQARINAEVYKLNSSLTGVERYLKELSGKNFERELPNLWVHTADERPLKEILRFSKAKGRLTLRFYTAENSAKFIGILLLTLLSLLFMQALKQKLRLLNALNPDYTDQLGMKYPLVSALIIVPSLFQFIFISPPFIISCLFALIPAVALCFAFAKFISAYWMRFWLAMTALFVLACVDNLILQEALTERWLLFFLALAGIFTGTMALFGARRHPPLERLILYFVFAHVLLEAVSLVCNLYGRYNLSKMFMICGYMCVIEGIVFLWTVRLINETLRLTFDVYKNPEIRSFYINFSRVGKKAPSLLYILVVVGWLIICGRTFYAFQQLSQPVIRFFLDPRIIGDYSFSIGSLLLFFGIIAVSVILSRLISLFASDRSAAYGPGGRKKNVGPGSWLLLVRVTIICLGLFLALAATGFPMDRLTIVVGALGVGIGLGLQTLVNNLVSGLIIAFEKPVNVGDTVDIAGVSGTMKSIGFRSSVIATAKGGDLVIPNGDLLNAHMINWTSGGDKRVVDITVGLAYGTELGPVKQLLRDLLKADERILQYPASQVLFLQFGNSSVDVQLTFWVRDFREMAIVKSDLIEAIEGQFRKQGIVIPFPQQDVYIHADQDGQKRGRDTDTESPLIQ